MMIAYTLSFIFLTIDLCFLFKLWLPTNFRIEAQILSNYEQLSKIAVVVLNVHRIQYNRNVKLKYVVDIFISIMINVDILCLFQDMGASRRGGRENWGICFPWLFQNNFFKLNVLR